MCGAGWYGWRWLRERWGRRQHEHLVGVDQIGVPRGQAVPVRDDRCLPVRSCFALCRCALEMAGETVFRDGPKVVAGADDDGFLFALPVLAGALAADTEAPARLDRIGFVRPAPAVRLWLVLVVLP